MCDEGDRYCFIVEWYDPAACLVRRYTFTFHDGDNSVEMYDPKNRRQFLKRAKVENVRLSDLFIGNSVNVLGRQLTFIAYGDEATRSRLTRQNERTLGIIKPDAMHHVGEILEMIFRSGLKLANLKTCSLNFNEVTDFYALSHPNENNGRAIDHLSNGTILAIEVKGEQAVKRWQDIVGPADPLTARRESPQSLRAIYGEDTIKNACHSSDNIELANSELDFFFPACGAKRRNTACFSETTCGVIKPHAVLDGRAGEIIRKIRDCGFEIPAMLMVNLDKANAEEFLEVYKGVVQEYPGMVTEMCSGPCIALEVRAQDAPRMFREFVGPADPEIARHLRPRTLRAQYGKTKTQNAIHCTDLPEDAMLELEYFFKVLDR